MADDPGVLGHALDEGAVELELVGRQVAEVGERRVAGAVVVHRDLDADGPEAVQHVEAPHPILHEAALGDLDGQSRRREVVLLQQLHDLVGKARSSRLEVDTLTATVSMMPLAAPLLALAARPPAAPTA